MIEITTQNDPRIAEFISIRDSVLHNQNLIIAETEKVFLQFRASNHRIFKILATETFIKKHSLSGDNVFCASQDILNNVAGFKLYYDVLFLAEKPADTPLDKLDNKILLLNGLSSPENVGSIARSAAAFEINSLITDEKTCSPFLRRCIRVSTGNVFSLHTHHSKNIRADLIQLRSIGYKIFVTANIPGSVNLNTFQFPEKYVVIIGSEGHGVDQDLIDAADCVLKIQINAQVAHLNASNAASIFLSRMTSL